jgi:hypothetical protein
MKTTAIRRYGEKLQFKKNNNCHIKVEAVTHIIQISR